MPRLFHSFVSAKSDSADASLVRPTNWNDSLQYGNLANSGPGGTYADILQVLTSDTNFYVYSSGSDANSGSSSSPFQTLNGAYNYITGNIYNAGFTAIVNIASGTFSQLTATVPPNGGPVQFDGAGSSLTTVTDGFALEMKYYGPQIIISHLKVQGAGGLQGTQLANVGWFSVDFSSLTPGVGQLDCRSGSKFYCLGSYSVSGSADAHIYTLGQGYVEFIAPTITFTTTVAYVSFCYAQQKSMVSAFSITWSGSASVTGTRYSVGTQAGVNTFGAGVNYFPGTGAGSATSAEFALYF